MTPSAPPEEKEWVAALIEQAAVGVAWLDGDARFVRANAGFARIAGRTPEELSSTGLVEIAHPEDGHAVRAAVAELHAGGRDRLSLELRIALPDASLVRVGLTLARDPDEAGRLLVAVAQDLGAPRPLEHAELRFAYFMQHLPGLAWIKDVDGRYVYVNDGAEQAFGRPRHQLYGRTDDEVFPAQTAAQFRANDVKALDAGTRVETIETLEHANGVHHSLVSKFPIPGPEGRAVLVGGIAIDITDRLSAESAMREIESRFQDMADHVPVLIWMNGVSGCEFVNQEYLRFLGCELEEVRGDGWRRFLHPDDGEAYTEEYVRCVAARIPFEAPFRFRRADGEYRWLRSSGVPRSRADGMLVGYVGCSVDITEIKRSQDALREADRRKDEFLATLAHELRNPLAPIRSSVQLLREVSDAPEQMCAMLERQVDQMVRLVDELLEISRMTQGRIELQREPVELAEVLRAARETSQPVIEAGGHALEIALPPEPLIVDADPLRLAQVFVNLLDNAAKYTPDGGHIAVGAERRATR